ncbi:MAG: BON domain-containing protein [Planctomycetaceae bacterium]
MSLRFLMAMAVCLVVIAPEAFSQTTGGTTTTTTSSRSSTASNAGTSFGGSATGASSAGGGTAASGGVAQPQINTELGQAAQNLPDGFVGRSDTQTFVGNRNASQQSVDGGGQPQFSGAGQGGGNGGGQSVEGRGSQIRFRQRIAFAAPNLSGVVIESRLQRQFALLNSRFPGVVAVADQPGTVVLRGEVESEAAVALAVAVARLEPGVRQVRSELTINAAETAPVP